MFTSINDLDIEGIKVIYSEHKLNGKCVEARIDKLKNMPTSVVKILSRPGLYIPKGINEVYVGQGDTSKGNKKQNVYQRCMSHIDEFKFCKSVLFFVGSEEHQLQAGQLDFIENHIKLLIQTAGNYKLNQNEPHVSDHISEEQKYQSEKYIDGMKYILNMIGYNNLLENYNSIKIINELQTLPIIKKQIEPIENINKEKQNDKDLFRFDDGKYIIIGTSRNDFSRKIQVHMCNIYENFREIVLNPDNKRYHRSTEFKSGGRYYIEKAKVWANTGWQGKQKGHEELVGIVNNLLKLFKIENYTLIIDGEIISSMEI